jgi:hypothetical protein
MMFRVSCSVLWVVAGWGNGCGVCVVLCEVCCIVCRTLVIVVLVVLGLMC